MKKKTDRRTLYTQSVIKDAFLTLIAEKPYDRINVTELCKKAEISRSTFYLHFENVDDVLDRVIDDALLFSETSSTTFFELADFLSNPCSEDSFKEHETLLPACQRIADSDRYHALFMDPIISDYIIQRIARHEEKTVIPAIMERGNLTNEEAEMLFRFILHGSFAVNRSLQWQKDSRWYRYQSLLSHFVNGGMKDVSKGRFS